MNIKPKLIAGLATFFLLGTPLLFAANDVDSDTATQTDVIGSKEAPSVFNIVPWKDKSMTTQQKRAVNTSILRETLQPLDREVLRREVKLQRSLNKE